MQWLNQKKTSVHDPLPGRRNSVSGNDHQALKGDNWEVHLIWHKNQPATSLPSHSCTPYLQTLSCHLYAATNQLNMQIKVWMLRLKTMACNRIVSTLWSISNFFSCFARRSIQSKAKSYSIVLGWEQCEVDTAFFCRKDSCVKYQAKERKISQQSIIIKHTPALLAAFDQF